MRSITLSNFAIGFFCRFFLSGVLILSVVACFPDDGEEPIGQRSSETVEQQPTKNTAAIEETPKPTEATIGDVAGTIVGSGLGVGAYALIKGTYIKTGLPPAFGAAVLIPALVRTIGFGYNYCALVYDSLKQKLDDAAYHMAKNKVAERESN